MIKKFDGFTLSLGFIFLLGGLVLFAWFAYMETTIEESTYALKLCSAFMAVFGLINLLTSKKRSDPEIETDPRIEAAKRTAAERPGELIKVELSENEDFSVCYDASSGTYACSRQMKLKPEPLQ